MHKLVCRSCAREEIPINGTVLILLPIGGRFPVFASTCNSCGVQACLDCTPFRNVPGEYYHFINTLPQNVCFHSFKCRNCEQEQPFPSSNIPIRLFVYESCLCFVNHDEIKKYNETAKLLHLHTYDISVLHGLKEDENDIVRADGLGGLITSGLGGVMPIRCSKER